MAKKFILSVCSWALLSPIPATAEFIGQFELGPPGCEESGICSLTYDFKYKDPNDMEWQAAAQNTTDGASIPVWARPFIGEPFDRAFIQAAVIHDHYCDRHVRGWRPTHRVFYDALLELGVGTAKAKLMYYGVYLGGPKWVRLIPGRNCGENCVFKVQVEGANTTSDNHTIVSRPASYDQNAFAEELTKVEKLLKEQGENVDLQMLERRAKEKRPNDFFYLNEDEVTINSSILRE